MTNCEVRVRIDASSVPLLLRLRVREERFGSSWQDLRDVRISPEGKGTESRRDGSMVVTRCARFVRAEREMRGTKPSKWRRR